MSPLRSRPRRRALHVAVLLLALALPLQGALDLAASAQSPFTQASVAERQLSHDRAPKVTLSLGKARVTSHQQARGKIVVTPKATRSAVVRARELRSLRHGRVQILVKGAGHRRIVHAHLDHRRVHITLPKLGEGVYRLRARFLGNEVLAAAASRARTLVVTAAGGPSSPGDFPDASNTGVPAGTTLTDYSGPCVINNDGTVIDSKRVACDLRIRAKNVVIKNSSLQTVTMDQDEMHADGKSGWSFSITDSVVDGGTNDGPGVCCGNYKVTRVEMKGGHNGAQCENDASYCDVEDSWIHSQYEPKGGLRHLGGFLNDGGTPSTLIHNSITCDAPAENDEGGCTGDINLIPNFGVMQDVLVQNNYLGANANSAYCTYAGATPGLNGYASQSNHIVYQDNLFGRSDTIASPAPGQPGHTDRCAAYGPVSGFDVDGPGNVWTGNRYDDGTAILCDEAHRCD